MEDELSTVQEKYSELVEDVEVFKDIVWKYNNLDAEVHGLRRQHAIDMAANASLVKEMTKLKQVSNNLSH